MQAASSVSHPVFHPIVVRIFTHDDSSETNLTNSIQSVFDFYNQQRPSEGSLLVREGNFVSRHFHLARELLAIGEISRKQCPELPEEFDPFEAQRMIKQKLVNSPKLSAQDFMNVRAEFNANPEILMQILGQAMPNSPLPPAEIAQVMAMLNQVSPEQFLQAQNNFFSSQTSDNLQEENLTRILNDQTLGNLDEISKAFLTYLENPTKLETEFNAAFNKDLQNLYKDREAIDPALTQLFTADWANLPTGAKIRFSSLVGKELLFKDNNFFYSTWKPSDSIEGFATAIANGPMILIGTMGLSTYECDPHEMVHEVAGKRVFGWGGNDKKVEAKVLSIIMVTGVNLEKGLVYYTDPIDYTQGRTFITPYSKLAEKVVDKWLRPSTHLKATEFAVQFNQ